MIAAALYSSYDQWDPCGEGEQLQVPSVPSATAEEIQGLNSYAENFLFRGHRKFTDSVHLSVAFQSSAESLALS